MYGEGDLEALACPRWKRRELSELVGLQARLDAVVRYAAEWSAPARYRGEPPTVPARLDRPLIQHDRLPYRQPRNIAGRYIALRRAHVVPDGKVEMMIAKPFLGEPFLVPVLCVAGIQVDEHTPAASWLQRGEREMAADVHEQISGIHHPDQLFHAQSGALSIVALGNERRASGKSEAFGHVPEVGEVD